MRDEIDLVREEIRQLRAETRALRRQRWIWAACVVMLASAFPALSGPSAPQDLVCKSLKIVGADGKPRIVLRTDMEELPGRMLKNGGSTKPTKTSTEIGVIEVLRSDGKKDLELYSFNHGGLVHVNGAQSSFAGITANDAGVSVSLWDKAGRPIKSLP